MTPVLQRLVASTLCVLLRFLLLREMSLTVCDHTTHMINVLIIVPGRVFGWIMFKDRDDFPSTV